MLADLWQEGEEEQCQPGPGCEAAGPVDLEVGAAHALPQDVAGHTAVESRVRNINLKIKKFGIF